MDILRKKTEKMLGSERYRFTLRQLTTDYHFKLDAEIRRLLKAPALAAGFVAAQEKVKALIDELNAITLVTRILETKNLLPTVGRAAIMNHLTNASPSPSTLRINYGAVGSGSTAPANGDTTLATETYRNAIASETNDNNVGYVTIFLSATEFSGTIAEVGLFIAGTASANSGTLFSRALLSVVKTSTETLTVDYTITLS